MCSWGKVWGVCPVWMTVDAISSVALVNSYKLVLNYKIGAERAVEHNVNLP